MEVITSRILQNCRGAERLSVNSPFQSVGHNIKIQVFKGKVLCQTFFFLKKFLTTFPPSEKEKNNNLRADVNY